ncbi:exodeoxyribonuclease V subunit alpha [Colwellia psychrerythraea]|uniref:RecBCD enzyme subunit RecD n=1 Tax=Colwellia psychrerythraea TaxID=28229 RepID=A0A099KPX7_COLPS|nr:exodeoxyribonuclease V subunit alpha [Colwellia psychrerythraea]KGJ91967.1 exodeoxyribonuclease V, alpha subunit [Colwellia psychrerythraea]
MLDNSMNKPVYSRFTQVQKVIQGVEAIDYFFAKEMFSALIPSTKSRFSTEETVDLFSDTMTDINHYDNLYHLFLALSASLRAGHSCLPLNEIADQHWGKGFVSTKKEFQQENDGLTQELSHAGFVFAPLAQLQAMLKELNILATDQQLLVLHDDKLYLRRYFQFENDLSIALNGRLLQKCQYDNNSIRQCIDSLFPDESLETSGQGISKQATTIDWQKIAVANAINKNFSVIAGGPGTGKTYTVTKLLAALLMLEQLDLEQTEAAPQNHQEAAALNIALVAPTGKAAQRLSESIVNAVSGFKGLIDDKVLAEIPTQAQTLHRLLGVLPNSPNFRHHEENRLSYDIVLIDEVSMVDLPLMTRVFRALKETAKVILLGDADQLPSVAAGSVLADIAPRPHGGFSVENEQYLSQVCQFSPEQLNTYFMANRQGNQSDAHRNVAKINSVDYLTFLVKSRRFDGQGGIGLIANSVIEGDVKRSWKLLSDSITQVPEGQLTLAQGELSTWLAPLVRQYYQPIESCRSVSDAFALLSQFRVLCATRQGDYGVERLNEMIKSYLGKNNAPYQQNQHALYHGQPIMINENDYRLGLYNGDIGIIWRIVDQAGKTHLMACFEDSTSQSKMLDTSEPATQVIRQILPSRLPKFESVYAMTIHKTQGSEFSHVAMVISATQSEQQSLLQGQQQRGSKLLSRELLYTGITRAKKQLTIAANQRVWQQGVTGQVKRHSGLNLHSYGTSK